MAKLSLIEISTGYNSVDTLNANFARVEAAIENTLSRDGTTPNNMAAALDMDSNRVINVGTPVDGSDAVRLIDLQSAAVASPVPDQSTHGGKVLETNGSVLRWRTAGEVIGTETSASADTLAYFTGSTTLAITPITSVGRQLLGLGSVDDLAALTDVPTRQQMDVQDAVTYSLAIREVRSLPYDMRRQCVRYAPHGVDYTNNIPDIITMSGGATQWHGTDKDPLGVSFANGMGRGNEPVEYFGELGSSGLDGYAPADAGVQHVWAVLNNDETVGIELNPRPNHMWHTYPKNGYDAWNLYRATQATPINEFANNGSGVKYNNTNVTLSAARTKHFANSLLFNGTTSRLESIDVYDRWEGANDPSDACEIAIWFNINTLPGVGVAACLMSTGLLGFHLGMLNAAGTTYPRFVLSTDGSTWDQNFSGVTALSANVWYRLRVVKRWDIYSMWLSINGQPEIYQGNTGSLNIYRSGALNPGVANLGKTTIGCYHNGTIYTEYFDGYIDSWWYGPSASANSWETPSANAPSVRNVMNVGYFDVTSMEYREPTLGAGEDTNYSGYCRWQKKNKVWIGRIVRNSAGSVAAYNTALNGRMFNDWFNEHPTPGVTAQNLTFYHGLGTSPQDYNYYYTARAVPFPTGNQVLYGHSHIKPYYWDGVSNSYRSTAVSKYYINVPILSAGDDYVPYGDGSGGYTNLSNSTQWARYKYSWYADRGF